MTYVYIRHRTHTKMLFCGFFIRKEHTDMNEEELKAKEEALTEKEEALKKREEELTKREEELKAKEEDLNGLVAKITKEYEAKLKKQEDDFKKRLEEREKVIKQLLNGQDGPNNKTSSEIEELNARRQAQKRI